MLASDDPIYVDARARFEASAGDSENMAIWKQNGPITIRTKKEADGTTTAIGEHARMDATPEEILPYFAEWADNCCEVNSNITAAAWVGKLDGVRVARWVGSAPFPLSSRVAYTRMYPDVGNMDDIRAYMTSQGTEAITAEAHFGAGEDATFALMDIKVAGWSVTPIKEGGKVVACRARYVYSARLGGNLPDFVSDIKTPGIVDAALEGLEKWVQKRRG